MATKYVWDDELQAVRDLRRLNADVHDAELAKVAGVSRNTLVRYMNGGDPPHSVVRALAAHLGVSVEARRDIPWFDADELVPEPVGAVA